MFAMRFALIAFLFFHALFAHASAERLSVVADEWPPFSGENLPEQGISIDVIRTVLARAGYESSSEILPWGRIMSGAQTGEYDIVGSLFFDPELNSVIAYSDPFFTTEIRFVRATGSSATYSDLPSLAPYSIAVGIGFLYEDEFDRDESLRKVDVTTTLQGLRMVASGRVDLTLDSEHVVQYSIENEDPNLRDRLEFVGPAIATRNIHMGVSRSLPNYEQIIADFNRALAEMREDGALDALLKKHIPN